MPLRHAHESTVADRLFARAIEGMPAQVPHTVIYIEDFGRALVTLGHHGEALGKIWHVPHAETVTMRAFVQLVFDAAAATVAWFRDHRAV